MPEEKDQEAPPIHLFDVTRKTMVRGKEIEVTLPFYQQEYKKGDKEGQTYPAPIVTLENLPLVLNYLGDEVLVGIASQRFNLKAQGWASEATSDDGVFDEEKFKEYASSFSARGESIPDLIRQQEEMTAQLLEHLKHGRVPDAMALRDKIVGVKAAISQKRRKTKEEKEAEEKAAATA